MNYNNFFEPVQIGCNLNILRTNTKLELYQSINEETDRVCSICQQNYINSEFIRKINHCRHFYHQDCLDKWFENNTKCPECKYDVRGNNTNQTENTNRNNNENTHANIFATSIPLYSLESTSSTNPIINQLIENIIRSLNNTNNSNLSDHNTSSNEASEFGQTFVDIQYINPILSEEIRRNSTHPRNHFQSEEEGERNNNEEESDEEDKSYYAQRLHNLEKDIEEIKNKLFKFESSEKNYYELDEDNFEIDLNIPSIKHNLNQPNLSNYLDDDKTEDENEEDEEPENNNIDNKKNILLKACERIWNLF